MSLELVERGLLEGLRLLEREKERKKGEGWRRVERVKRLER